MEINSGHSNVQIAIAVQPQVQNNRAEEMESGNDYSFTQAEPRPSLNTSGQEVGNYVNTWA